jgi:ABC-type glycerol-3-phosphate transport system permease component
MNFPGRALPFALVVALLVVPLQMTLKPILELCGNLDLSGMFSHSSGSSCGTCWPVR